jgi:hypothetical protein
MTITICSSSPQACPASEADASTEAGYLVVFGSGRSAVRSREQAMTDWNRKLPRRIGRAKRDRRLSEPMQGRTVAFDCTPRFPGSRGRGSVRSRQRGRLPHRLRRSRCVRCAAASCRQRATPAEQATHAGGGGSCARGTPSRSRGPPRVEARRLVPARLRGRAAHGDSRARHPSPRHGTRLRRGGPLLEPYGFASLRASSRSQGRVLWP